MSKRIIDSRFVVLRTLGSGAAGEVFEVSLNENTSYGCYNDRFALKLYKPWVLAQKNQSYRIRRELAIGTSIDSKNVVKTYELGSDNGQPFLVMEYLHGKNLRNWMRDHPNLTFNELMELAEGIISGIYSLHTHKIIHRDIKPANIIITDRGPVILDLGVLKDLTTDTITSREFLGTISYAAPEYLLGETYGPNIDVYSFGLIFYELIAGRLPYLDENPRKIIVEKNKEHPRRLLKRLKVPSIYNLNERAFLLALLDGCITNNIANEYSARVEFNRLSSEQVISGIRARLWERYFTYPVALSSDSPLFLLPELTYEVETALENFFSRDWQSLPPKAARILNEISIREKYLESFRITDLISPKPKNPDLVDRMFCGGLIETKLVRKDRRLYYVIAPLAYELLLHNIVRPQ